MSKLINESILVYRDQNAAIIAFTWGRHLYRVESIIAWWREPAEWWDGKPVRCFLRLNVRSSGTGVGIYEVCRLGKRWILHRILD